MNQLAIFTTPKPFVDVHISTIQRNAILSWVALGERVEIWLVGEEPGVEETARDLGVHYIPDVERTASGTPCIDSIFKQLRQESSADYLCYVNADILLFPDLLTTLDLVINSSKQFLLVGQRWDMNIATPLAIDAGWHTSFLKTYKNEARLHPPAGSDYFIFPRTGFKQIPPFAVGRIGWDNWMIYHARCEHMDVIDCTGAVTAVHQNHDFRHLPGGKKHRRQPESLENVTLAGGRQAMFTLANANKRILNGHVTRPQRSREGLMREVSIWPIIHLKPGWLAKTVYTLINPKKVAEDRKKEKRMKENIAKTIKESS